MTRFFVRPDQISGSRAVLEADDAYHVRTVLRMQAGDSVAVLDGSGAEYPGIIEEIRKQSVSLNLGNPWNPATEPDCKITVAQALPRMAEKMEQVLEHGTEVGVSGFWAFRTARSLPHLDGERQAKRLLRLGKIIKSAAEQSHRALLPSLVVDGDLTDVLQCAGAFDLAVIADPASELPLRLALPAAVSKPRVLLLIGPESGFTEEELREAGRAGAAAVSLGPRILRTETAALAASAQILFAYELLA
jgi:16S rRNA (uracil1498-N3)-methyltransferase